VEQKKYNMDLKKIIREIPDYPKPGINFIDITTLLKDPLAFRMVVDDISETFKNKGITKIVSLESRGFIVGGAIAYKLNAGFVPIRKKGKLPSVTISESYELEYGEDLIEIHVDALNPNDTILIHDDLLATGGTAMAALNLVNKLNVKKVYFSFIIDLGFLKTKQKTELFKHEVHKILTY
jgi:adenine phosphoribosyltransferase